MEWLRRRCAVRVGVVQRIGTLGILGVLGLLLVLSIYVMGQRCEERLHLQVEVLDAAHRRFMEISTELARVQQSEAAFLMAPGQAHAAQHRLALEQAWADDNGVGDQPDLPPTALARARLASSAVQAYAKLTLNVLLRQEALGYDSESGLQGMLQSSTADLAAFIATTGDSNLIEKWFILEVLQTNVARYGTMQAEAAFVAQSGNMVAVLGDSRLPAATRSELTTRLKRFQQQLDRWQEARSAFRDSVQAAEMAYEDARGASDSALNFATAERGQQQARLKLVRDQTTLLMYVTIVAATLAVAVLAWRIGRSIAQPLAGVASLTRQLAAGDVNLSISFTERRDEVGDVARALAVFRNTIDMNRAATERIYELAHHDSLTGLANRTLLHETLAKAISHGHRSDTSVIVLCLDLDGFKAVNDLYGHAAGDRLLVEVAARLSGNTRETDTAARLGGDEFALIHPCTGDPGLAAQALCERLFATLSKPYKLTSDGLEGNVTVSIGAALFPSDGLTPPELLRNADTALYRAKADGKNCMSFFCQQMDHDLREQRAMEHDLQHAIARGELALAWQPLVQTRDDGKVAGFEVLLRWNKPEGMIPPDVFIPVAESCGAIHAIGRWVLQQACAEAASWPEPLEVAVNVSPVQIQFGDSFADVVEHALSESGLAPARLTLEVTEGVLIREPERVLTILRRLKSLGVRFALDDFGTGYSSLATLRAFPFDKIKIDRSFTSGLTESGPDAAIVRAVLGLARGLDLPVVAEGVETAAQLAALRDERCAEVQGWLVGRPAPITTFTWHTNAAQDAPCSAEAAARASTLQVGLIGEMPHAEAVVADAAA